MTVVSSRHALAAAALLLIAAAPVWFHAAVAPTYDDCARPEAFFGASRIGGVAVGAPSDSLHHVQHVQGGTEVQGRAISFRVVRSFDPSSFYWRPIAFGFDTLLYLQPAELERVEAGDDVLPVHWSVDASQSLSRLEGYAYVQGGEPVRHPVRSGLALALPQLVTGTRPVTLLVVWGASGRGELPVVRREAERWLAAAWQELEAACDF